MANKILAQDGNLSEHDGGAVLVTITKDGRDNCFEVEVKSGSSQGKKAQFIETSPSLAYFNEQVVLPSH